MKRSVSAAAALLSVAFALPVWAQDPPPETSGTTTDSSDAGSAAEAPAADSTTPPADSGAAPEAAASETAAPASDTGTAEATPAEGSTDQTAGSEAAPAEAAPAEATAEAPAEGSAEVSAEAAPAEEAASAGAGEPFYLYAGVDYANVTLSLSDEAREASFGGRNPRSDMYRLHVGTRLFGAIGLEAQYGIPDTKDDGTAGKFEVSEYYGAYVVPTGTLFDLVEISVPVGYSVFKAERGNASVELDGVSYGVNLEVPITIGASWLPDLRIGGGGLVYQAHDNARVYGYHFGVRADFKI